MNIPVITNMHLLAVDKEPKSSTGSDVDVF